MNKTIVEMVSYCDWYGKDAVEVERDYFAEKDSRITRLEAARLVERARQEISRQQDAAMYEWQL